MTSRVLSLLLAAAPYVVIAAPYISLPNPISEKVPQCARSCFRGVGSNFALSCFDAPDDLNCFCSSYSSNHLTLGEEALKCFYQNCPDNAEQRKDVYNICFGQSNMARPTNSRIAVQSLPVSTPAPTPTDAQSSEETSYTETMQPTIIVNPPRPTPLMTSLPNGGPSPASETNLGPSAAAESSSNASGPLSTAQIVGVSIAGASALILAAGAIILMTCLQQRRGRRAMEQAKLNRLEKQNEKQEPAIHGAADAQSSLRPLILPSRVLRDPRGGTGGVGIAPPPESRSRSHSTSPRRSLVGLVPVQTNIPRVQINGQAERPQPRMGSTNVPSDQIGLALSPESELGNSPDSMRSERTVSRLLPAKPSPQLPRPNSTASGLTVFEEDLRKSMRQSQGVRPSLARLSAANAHAQFPVPPSYPSSPPTLPPIPRSATFSPIVPTPVPPTPPTFPNVYTDPSLLPRPLNHSRKPSDPFLDRHQIPEQAMAKQTPPVSFSPPSAAPQIALPLPPAPVRPKLPTPKEQPALSLNIPIRHSRVPLAPVQENPPSYAPSPILPPKPTPMKVFVPPEYTSPGAEAPPKATETPLILIASRNNRASGYSSSDASSDGSSSYIPKYYSTPKMASETLDLASKSPRLINIRRANSSRNSASVSRTSTTKSASGRDSMASCTTFESADLDEPTPPSDEEEKPLSAIPESPIAGLRYPKVPRASNQAVPRSPRNSRDALNADTRPSLLAKRRGEEAAQDLEKRLFVSSASSSLRSSNISQQTNGRASGDGTLRQTVVSSEVEFGPGPLSAEMALKSPTWARAPRITPTRRGQDLFLSVS